MFLLSSHRLKYFLIGLSIIVQGNLLAMRGSYREDPLANLKYRVAFDQSKIHEEFADCMERWGCADNVFEKEKQKDIIQQAKEKAFKKGFAAEDRERAYQSACLAKLRNARRWAITEPIQDLVTSSMVSICAACGLHALLKHLKTEQSFATGIGYLDAVYGAAFRSEEAIRSFFHILRTPEQKLDRLEECFAKNMCFIPHKLWGKIIEEFMVARTNSSSLDVHLNNIEFVIDLTVYKPRKSLIVAGDKTFEETLNEICSRIDHFFKSSYQVPQEYSTQDIEGIKQSVRQFLFSLAYNAQGQNQIKPLYLKGSHGIGKSYFVVDNLYKWIEELFPGGVHFEQIPYLESAGTLQGIVGCEHGMMLDVVHNLYRENKRGALLFMDEATWLNNPCVVDVAKIVFNGSQSRISTKYFGDAIDIPVPPMLVIVASNEPIRDEHLANRFVLADFPVPTLDALVDYALRVAEQDESLSLMGITVTRAEVQNFFNLLPSKGPADEKKVINNFRDADKIVTHLLTKAAA